MENYQSNMRRIIDYDWSIFYDLRSYYHYDFYYRSRISESAPNSVFHRQSCYSFAHHDAHSVHFKVVVHKSIS